MIIGGLQKFSLIDYPDHLSAIVFTQGCNFRCQYCYNPVLVYPEIGDGKVKNISSSDLSDEEVKEGYSQITENAFFDFLKLRVNKLDAIVITGGEPTIHNDLPEFINKIKKFNFKIKLDTNGTNPEMLNKLINLKLLDYIAMDIKASINKYDLVVGVQPDLEKLKKSIKIIKNSKLPYEFRTTVVPKLINKDDIYNMGELIQGAEKWYLQQFKSDTDLVNPSFRGAAPYSSAELAEMEKIARQFVKFCQVR